MQMYGGTGPAGARGRKIFAMVRIGVVPGSRNTPHGRAYDLGFSYVEGVAQAGALPVILPFTRSLARVEAYLDLVDGLLLTGGGDIAALAYDQDPVRVWGPDPERDAFEILLVQEARRRKLPIFAICRGIQILNVAYGGTLIQHLETGQQHAPRRAEEAIYHRISVDPESLLYQLLGRDTLVVNSYHHQALHQLGDGLRDVAWASDGTIEAVESTEPGHFVLGVQFHPERMLEGPEARILFQAFVQAAQGR